MTRLLQIKIRIGARLKVAAEKLALDRFREGHGFIRVVKRFNFNAALASAVSGLLGKRVFPQPL